MTGCLVSLQIMLTIGRGQHGSTYGGNPVAARVALAALQVIVDEGLVENSYKLGQLLRHELQTIQSRIVTEVGACARPAADMSALASVQLTVDMLPSLPGRWPSSALLRNGHSTILSAPQAGTGCRYWP